MILSISLLALIFITNVFGQCTVCAPNQGCCMGRMRGEWSCCGPRYRLIGAEEATPWDFSLDISYENTYVWDCTPSNNDPTQKYTNISCILDGRWSVDHLTFQLKSIPSTELKSINATYTMKDSEPRSISFQADSQWALTLPVDKNVEKGIYDEIEFNYGGFNYTYYFGYGPVPHCPRC